MAQKLTAKQRKWIKVYSETLNATEAAMQVYNCKDRNSAKVIGSENISKLNFEELMEVVGLTDEKLAKVGNEGLSATKPIVTPEGVKAVPDYAVRHRYWETFLKLKRKLVDKMEITGEDGGPIRVQVVAGSGYMKAIEGEIVE